MKKAEEKELLNYAKSNNPRYADNPTAFNKLITSYAEQRGFSASEGDICRIVRKVLFSNPPPPKVEPLDIFTAKELLESDLPPLEFCVDGLISHGVTILSAKSKFYKSWLAMQMCLCVSQGKPFLGFKTHKSSCLYVDLENDKRLSKERLNLMLGDAEAPSNFFIVNSVPTMEHGFISAMEQVISEYPQIKLIVVDVFRNIKHEKKRNETDYDADYRSITELKEFATKYDLAILLISHNRKAVDPTDPFANILGSTALMGATDAAIVIYKDKRSDKESTISITGRTVQNQDYKGFFDTECYQWKLLGNLDDYMEQQEEKAYLENPVVTTISLLIQENGSWCGFISELIQKSYETDSPIHESPQAIGRNMATLKQQLLRYGNIHVIEKKNGSGSKRYQFIKTA